MAWLSDDNGKKKKGTSWLSGGSTPTTKDPTQAVKTEISNKQYALSKYSVPDPTQKSDDRNWLERKLNTPKNTGLLGDVLDVLSRGQYASANAFKEIYDTNKSSAADVLRAAGRGVTGKDRTSYSDVLAMSTIQPGWKRSVLGFIGDVVLDPTTYLTLGTGAAAKTAGKAGLRFAGKTIVPISAFEKAAEITRLDKAAKAIRNTRPIQTLGKGFIPNFREVGTDKNIWDGYVDLKKGYKNTLNYSQQKAVEDAISFGKTLTKEQRELVTHAIQNPELLKGADPEVIGAVEKAKGMFEAGAKREQELGLLKNMRENYVPGIYPEKGKSALSGIIHNPSLQATLGKHNKAKKFNTLQEAIDAGLSPETDIAKLVGLRTVAGKRAITTQEFIDETLAKFGQKIKPKDINKVDESMGVFLPKGSLKFFPQGTVSNALLELAKSNPDELIEIPANAVKKGMGISKNVPIYALPRQIAKDLNQFKKGAWDEGSQGILKAYDSALGLWKGYATAVNPGFHLRNAESNTFQTYLNSGKALLNPANHLKAAGTLLADKSVPFFSNAAKSATVEIGGKKIPLPELKDLMKKEGVLDTGYFERDLSTHLEDKLNQGIKDKALKLDNLNLINPLSQKNALIRAGRFIGGGVENQAKSFNFLADAKKTGSVKQAAKNVDKYLFDYGDTTDFEKNVMRRVIPFYTWLRKNVPLQAQQLIEQPGKYAAIPKAINAIEENSKPTDETYLPQYMENWVRTPFEQAGNPMYWNPNQPYGDLDRLNPADLEKNLFGMTSPFIKAPIELMANRNMFFQSPIERYKGEMKDAPAYLPKLPEPLQKIIGAETITKDGETKLQVPAKLRYLMQQVPFTENISKSMEYKDDKKFNQLLSFLLGAKIAPYDIEKSKKNALYDQRQELRDMIDKLQNKGTLPQDLKDDYKENDSKKTTKRKWLQ